MIWSKDCIPIGYFILAIALPNYTGAKLSIFRNIAKHSCFIFHHIIIIVYFCTQKTFTFSLESPVFIGVSAQKVKGEG